MSAGQNRRYAKAAESDRTNICSRSGNAFFLEPRGLSPLPPHASEIASLTIRMILAATAVTRRAPSRADKVISIARSAPSSQARSSRLNGRITTSGMVAGNGVSPPGAPVVAKSNSAVAVLRHISSARCRLKPHRSRTYWSKFGKCCR